MYSSVCPTPYYPPKYMTAGGKNQAPKDLTTNRWHQNAPTLAMHPLQHPYQTTTPHNSNQHRHMNNDGGWSRGSPAKGSGWSSKNKRHSMPAGDTTKTGNQNNSEAVDWGGSPEVDSAAVWPVPERKHQGSSGSGDGGGWNTFSPGQSNSSRQHSQAENWISDESNLSVGENACSPRSNSSPSPSSPSNTEWNAVSDIHVPNIQHELEPIEDDDKLDEEIPCSCADDARAGAMQLSQVVDYGDVGKNEEEGQRSNSHWVDLVSIPPITSVDKDLLEYAKESLSSSDDDQQHHTSGTSSKNTSCSPTGDIEKTVEGGIDTALSTVRDSPKELTTGNMSHCRDLGSGVTPDGGSTSMGVWKSCASVGSTSSINSIGSSSSWKSDGKSGHHNKPNFSPRKSTRYDSQSSAVSSGSSMKLHVRKAKKPSSGLDDALESLHSEPSGWGDLPSPKLTDVDNGTEIWGVAPDDMHRKSRGCNGWGESGSGRLGKVGGGEWDEDTCNTGTTITGWPVAGDGRARTLSTPGTPGSQWIPSNKDGWGKKSKQHNFPDNVSKLMDMGFSHKMAEKYLKANGNDLNATIGDLLAVSVVGDDGSLEQMNGSCGSRTSKKQPGKVLPGGNHLYGAGCNVISTLSSGSPCGTHGLTNKDLYHQQLLQNSLAQSHSQLLTCGTQPQQMMHQRYMQMPPSTMHGYQQMLGQQLSHFKSAKQNVIQQLKQLNAIVMQGGGGSAQQQFKQLQTRLSHINQFISHINQQLILHKYPSQQTKDISGIIDGVKSLTPGATGSQPMGRNTPPSVSKDMKTSGPPPSRSMSLPGVVHDHNLALGMQGLSMDGHATPSSISQSSARSVSRLQQIISSSSEDNPPNSADDKTKSCFPSIPQSSTAPAKMYSSTSCSLASRVSSTTTTTTTTTPASTPFSPTRSFTDIQEFRPGVPWQPRTLPTEPAQLYAKPGMTQHPELRTAQSEPSFSHQIGSNFPLGAGMGQQRRPPSLFYNPPGVNVGGLRGRSTPGDEQQHSWQLNLAHNNPMTNSPFGVTSTQYSAFPSNSYGRGQRHQTQVPPPNSTNLQFSGSGELGHALSRPNALFPNPRVFSQAPGITSSPSSSSDTGGRWEPSHGTSPTSNMSSSSSYHPPPSLTSSSVWDSSTAGSNLSSWSGIGIDKSSGYVATPASTTEQAVPHFSSCTNISSSEGMTPGLNRAWEKRGLQSPNHKSSILSPEPTFAEWQAGKKAHLSVFKLPSNPPSSWLYIQNIKSQVDEASLRDVCSEFGILETVTLSRDSETAFVQYANKEHAIQAKSGLDKSPVICGVTIVVDFVSEEKVSSFFFQQSHQKQMAGSLSSVRHDKWSTANPQPAGNSGGHIGANRNLKRHSAQTHDNPRNNTNETNAGVLWSGNAFLPGLTSPWGSQTQVEPALTRADKQDPPTVSSSPSLSTYLPNGLF